MSNIVECPWVSVQTFNNPQPSLSASATPVVQGTASSPSLPIRLDSVSLVDDMEEQSSLPIRPDPEEQNPRSPVSRGRKPNRDGTRRGKSRSQSSAGYDSSERRSLSYSPHHQSNSRSPSRRSPVKNTIRKITGNYQKC